MKGLKSDHTARVKTFIDRQDNLSISGNVFVDVIARCIPVSVVLYRIDE